MIYLDTNILAYATLSKADNIEQQRIATDLVKIHIDNDNLVLSNLNILEYSFVMSKAREDEEKIKKAVNFFVKFVKEEKTFFSKTIQYFLKDKYSFKNSFDLYHVAFAYEYKCDKIITFDKGFKKFKDKFDIKIEIL